MSWFDDKKQALKTNVIDCETLLKKKKKKKLREFSFQGAKIISEHNTHVHRTHQSNNGEIF